MNDRYYLDAKQAADALGVTRATLYAYTSRGQLRSEPAAGRTRERRYFREDVERLKIRKEARRDPAKVAAQGLRWGGPVLDSGITLIHDGACYYRGHDVMTLARTWSAEDVAALLWDSKAPGQPDRERVFEHPSPLPPRTLAQLRRSATDAFTLMQAALPIASARDLASYDTRPAAVRQAGGKIMRLLTAALSGHDIRQPVHRSLQHAWAPKRSAVGEIIRTVLVLCADHELNASAFTARCAASTGAPPYDVVSAAMATLKGFKHGGAAERVIALAREADTLKSARSAIANRLRRGERIPGFGHPLYPHGDPRARLLVRLAAESGHDRASTPYRHVIRAAAELLNDAPNLDCGLAAVTDAYQLPAQAPLLLFAVGRTIGWIAHAIEEYAAGQLIRPRARYTGPPPRG